VSCNSELYRRGIVLPLSAEACDAIRANSADENTPARTLNLSNDILFYDLWNWGILNQINAVCGSLIDEHEEDELPFEKLADVLGVIDEFLLKREAIGDRRTFLLALRQLCLAAQSSRTSLFFVL